MATFQFLALFLRSSSRTDSTNGCQWFSVGRKASVDLSCEESNGGNNTLLSRNARDSLFVGVKHILRRDYFRFSQVSISTNYNIFIGVFVCLRQSVCWALRIWLEVSVYWVSEIVRLRLEGWGTWACVFALLHMYKIPLCSEFYWCGFYLESPSCALSCDLKHIRTVSEYGWVLTDNMRSWRTVRTRRIFVWS